MMELNLEYEIDKNVSITFYKAVMGKKISKLHFSNLLDAFIFILLCITTAVLAIQLSKGYIALATFLLLIIRAPILWDSLSPLNNLVKDSPNKLVSLTVNDLGIREKVSGVESFSPWQSVKEYTIFHGILIIKLSSEQYAIIPNEFKNAKPEIFNKLIEKLDQNGIKKNLTLKKNE